MKQILSFLLLLIALPTVRAQQTPNKILDVNYLAVKNSFTLQVSGKIRESDNWGIRGFRSGLSYGTPGTSKFSIGYDIWRSDAANAPVGSSLVLRYLARSNSTNLNFSLIRYDDGYRAESWTGRIDIVSKW